MKTALSLVIVAAVTVIGSAANAAPPNAATSILKAPLGCSISYGKVIVITNTTGSDITAGTPMGYDAVRYGSRQHYGKTFAGPAMAVGGEPLRIGAEPSTSCTAWYRRTLAVGPQ